MCLSFKALRKTSQPASPGATSRIEPRERLAHTGSLNLNEEYAKAFRTQSYTEFWSKVQDLNGDQDQENGQTSSASPFHSYGILADHLLEPDQDAVRSILEQGILSKIPELYDLICDYFNNSAEASKLCGVLLKNIDQAKLNYRSIKNVLDITPTTGDLTNEQCHLTIAEFLLFIDVDNPFSDPTSHNFHTIHEGYASLLKRLEKNRKKVDRKLKLVNGCKSASALCLIAACAALAICAVVIASHALIAIVAGPVALAFPPSFAKQRIESLRLLGTSVLTRHSAQLDAAAKGTYILNRDFDTMSRLVTRLHDEVEHNKVMIKFCLQRKEDRHPVQEVVKQLRRNDTNFNQQLDELEDHVYLCFMTINRARSLVVQEIQLQQNANIVETQ
eukprot:Gb_00671 [translate_table: standard]